MVNFILHNLVNNNNQIIYDNIPEKKNQKKNYNKKFNFHNKNFFFVKI